ncbi:Predicted arabinose efflux permease, MFS family [Andreprevotia lacus DSM 23236]|jgi:diaminobutyrate-2-oxoglutarate transaminase|uniref:Predicted arabinose efflux permease, MFS family n=1 Tax=Andreprevotia lacus DSM 23236 TaxID=1121001 RepID=A0A1W1XNL7_9NEIS|nr:MFS transporter [Andreprevotia lacus]SMC25111.1 Predicted arabinose efflux permease, MFS family [Andreprevotia lacus DSM 23236]
MKKLFNRAFILLWLSETAFDIGAALMGFALGVWVFEQSGSVQQFSWAILISAVPALLCIPVAGALADWADRRWVIAACDMAYVLMIVVLAWLLFNSQLAITHFYIIGAVGSVIGALRSPSYQAAIAQIVPADKLTQANGLVHSSKGVLQIGAPLLTGYLMAAWGLRGIVLIELVMVLAGAVAVFAALTSASRAIRGHSDGAPFSLFAGIKASMAGVVDYFKTYPLMVGLAAYILIQEGLLILASSMLTPLILATHSKETLGAVMTLGAIGGVIGAVILASTNLKKHLMLWVLIADVGLALFVAGAGFGSSIEIWSLCAFGAFAFGGVSEGCASALWMRKVPKEKQGSVFAAIGAANLLVMCTVLLCGGALTEHVLEPLMMPGSALAEQLGPWLGTGKGRGVALLFILVGAVFALVSLVAMLNGRLIRLDELVPEQNRDDDETPPTTQTEDVLPPQPLAPAQA